MDEYTLSAFGVYSGGRAADAFAEVRDHSVAGCFAAMAGEVSGWLAGACERDPDREAPQAVALELEWSGAAVSAPAQEGDRPPGDTARQRIPTRGRTLSCGAPGRRCLGAQAALGAPGRCFS